MRHSHIVDVDDSPAIFRGLIPCGVHIQLTGLPQIATRNCRALIAEFWSPGSEAVDAFTVNWGSDINWWVPPYVQYKTAVC